MHTDAQGFIAILLKYRGELARHCELFVPGGVRVSLHDSSIKNEHFVDESPELRWNLHVVSTSYSWHPQ